MNEYASLMTTMVAGIKSEAGGLAGGFFPVVSVPIGMIIAEVLILRLVMPWFTGTNFFGARGWGMGNPSGRGHRYPNWDDGYWTEVSPHLEHEAVKAVIRESAVGEQSPVVGDSAEWVDAEMGDSFRLGGDFQPRSRDIPGLN